MKAIAFDPTGGPNQPPSHTSAAAGQLTGVPRSQKRRSGRCGLITALLLVGIVGTAHAGPVVPNSIQMQAGATLSDRDLHVNPPDVEEPEYSSFLYPGGFLVNGFQRRYAENHVFDFHSFPGGKIVGYRDAADPHVDPPEVEEPGYGIFLYSDGFFVHGFWCRYAENHVFDFHSGRIVGYRDAADPLRIVDEEGVEIGYLAAP